MDLYEAMYVALVRRLEEIADAQDDDAVDDCTRVGCYDMVAYAHAMGLEKIRKEAEVDCD
jgi:hypothetical protein